jgi:hypothetical protein
MTRVGRMSTGRKKYGSLSEQNYAEMKAASDARKKKKKNAQFTKLQESDAAGVKRDEAAAKRKKDAANTKTTYNKKTAISPETTPASRQLKKVKDSFSPKAREDAKAKALRLSKESRQRATDAVAKTRADRTARRNKISAPLQKTNAEIQKKIDAGSKNFTTAEKQSQAYRDANKTKTGLGRFFSKISDYGKRQAEGRKRKYEEAVAKKRSEGKTAGVGTIDMNKGGMIKKTYSAGGLTGGADMKVIDKEKETHTKYNEKPSKNYGNKKKKTNKKIVKKNAGGMIKAYSGGGAVKKKGIDGIALRGKTRATRSR